MGKCSLASSRWRFGLVRIWGGSCPSGRDCGGWALRRKLNWMLLGFRPIRCWLTQFHADGKATIVNRLAVSNASLRIQIPLDWSSGKVLVRLPRVFGQDAGAVSTDVDGVGEFMRDILEAAQFHEHLHGSADFRTTSSRPGCHRVAFSRWETRCCQSGWAAEN